LAKEDLIEFEGTVMDCWRCAVPGAARQRHETLAYFPAK